MNLEDIILRDTRANQPVATDVPTGTLYYVTDEYLLERSNGTTWDSYSGVLPYQNGRLTAQNAAVANVKTVTVPASDTSYEVSANVRVTTATTHSFTVTCTYTDEGGTSRTITLTFRLVASPTTITTTIANANGTVPYNGEVLHIRAKAATTIVIATTGTFTTVVYNVEGTINPITQS